MDKSKKIVILLGAGAAVPWGGKITNELTDDLINECTFKTNSNLNYLSFLQENLAEYYHDKNPSDINFEFILSSIEWLYEYYSAQEQKNKILYYLSDWTSLFLAKDNLEGEFPTITADTRPWVENSLCDYTFANNPNLKITVENGYPKSSFYYKLYFETIKNLKESISCYYEKENTTNNSSLTSFFEYFLNEGYVIRIYSTNYDNIPNKCFPKSQPLFNGFNMSSNGSEYFEKRSGEIDVRRIINDDNCNCFYNLHGSCNFDFHPYDYKVNGKCNEDEVKYREDNDIVYSDDDFNQTNQNGKPILNPTIITGQQKIIRTALEPYSSFMNSFKRDCLDDNCSEIICIGCSFSDEHLNQIFQVVLGEDKSPKITIVSKLDSECESGTDNHPTNLINSSKFKGIYPSDKYPGIGLTFDGTWWKNSQLPLKIFGGNFESYLRDKSYLNS